MDKAGQVWIDCTGLCICDLDKQGPRLEGMSRGPEGLRSQARHQGKITDKYEGHPFLGALIFKRLTCAGQVFR
jgi:hypothetical protein